MTTLRTAAQQALEALEYHVEQTRPIDKTDKAIAALKAALEQPEQKAKCDGGTCGLGGYCDECPKRQPEQEPVAVCEYCEKERPVTHPPRREWRGLTEEEVVDIWAAVSEDYDEDINIIELGRAIEQALKEKNHE